MLRRLAILLLTFAVLPAAAGAQTVAMHQATAASTGKTTPAQATTSAIIPGSPLAALTGAGTSPPDIDANNPSPFGTSSLALSLTSTIGDDAARTVGDFVHAIKQSTRLAPFFAWLNSVATLPQRRQHAMDIGRGLAETLLPAVLVENAIGFALARPRAALATRAARVAEASKPPDDEEAAPADNSEDVPADYIEGGSAADDIEGGSAADDIQGGSAAEAADTEKRPRRRDSLLAWSRRLVFALLHFGLALLPLVGFVIGMQSLVSAGFLASREARLGVIGIANAYLVCRLVLELLRLLVAPKAPSLRLIRMSSYRAAWLNAWLRILLFSGAVGYAVFSVGEVLGLSREAALPLIRLIALAIHIEVAICVWESRHLVGRWIAGKRNPSSYIAGFRHRFAAIWHYLALFYIMALWIAYAAGIHNAFGLLLRIVLVFVGALVIARLAWTGSSHVLERLFPDLTPETVRHPTLYARARAYNPLIRILIRIFIGILVMLGMLQGWGLNAFGWLLTDPFSRSLIAAIVAIIITIALALVLWEGSNAWINARIDRLMATGRTRQASRLRTLMPMLKATIGVAIFVVAGFICLSKIGVNAAPLLAGAGVVGIAVGFGSQKLVQDIITGLFLLLEDAMQVGDVITLAGMSGTVERLSIRTIRLRGGDGSINIIPFSAVTTVTNQTRDFGYAQISIQVGYEEDLARVYDVLTDIGRTMRAEPKWGLMMKDDLQIFGLDQFGASALVITGQIRTGPGQHWAVRREFYARVKKRFEEEHIEMPYTYLPPRPVVSGQLSAVIGDDAADKPDHSDHG